MGSVFAKIRIGFAPPSKIHHPDGYAKPVSFPAFRMLDPNVSVSELSLNLGTRRRIRVRP